MIIVSATIGGTEMEEITEQNLGTVLNVIHRELYEQHKRLQRVMEHLDASSARWEQLMDARLSIGDAMVNVSRAIL